MCWKISTEDKNQKVRKKEASVSLQCVLSLPVSTSWMEGFSTKILYLTRETNSPTFFLPHFSFISFDEDILALKMTGGSFYTELPVELLPFTSVQGK